MNIKDKDLNLLVIFDALMRELNVSRAAQRLGLSQPAMSHALARLRENFGDPLFARLPRGMAPTPRALELKAEISSLLESAEKLYRTGEAFDPAKAEGRIVVETADYFEHIVYPKFLPLLAREAPGVALVSRHLRGEFPKKALENGDADVAIAGFFTEIPEGFFQQMLFEDELVCVVRRNSKLCEGTLDLQRYVEAQHILVSLQGDLFGKVDAALAKKKLKRKVVAGISNFITPGAIVAESDFILTGPARLARAYQDRFPVEIRPLPIPVPGMTLLQVWHERTHRDPLLRWFRGKLRDFCATQLEVKDRGKKLGKTR